MSLFLRVFDLGLTDTSPGQKENELVVFGLVADLTDSRICKTDSLSGRQIYNADRVRQALV